MPINIPIDWASVDWGTVGFLSGLAFVAALIGNLVLFVNRLWAAVLAGLLFAAGYVFWTYYPHHIALPWMKPRAEAPAGFTLASPEIAAGGSIPSEQVYNAFGCNGLNISPELRWTNAPAGAKSYAITMFDLDAPTGSGWWHWVVVNIPPNATFLPRNAGDPKAGLAPPGTVQTRTDFGAPGYGGPCPPRGDTPHRYQFTVYVVDVDQLPGVEDNPSPALVSFNLHFHTLGKATLIGRYGR
jgi:Raf kinase inhibitor-like YbhB/YbcL family protein